MIKFGLDNYPKSYGSVDQNKYRFEKYLELSNRSLRFVENKFWKFVKKTASETKAVTTYHKLKYISSGWEWSVFLSKSKVVKVPAGIFPDVSDEKYLINTRIAYELIVDNIPSKFIAQTTFERKNNQNIMIQEYIDGKDNFVIGYHTKNSELLNNVKELLNFILVLLDKKRWLPDFDIRRLKGGFVLRNIIFDKEFCPKIIDFTAYYDVYRLYPYRQQTEISSKKKKIKDLLSWIQLREISR